MTSNGYNLSSDSSCNFNRAGDLGFLVPARRALRDLQIAVEQLGAGMACSAGRT
jgi:hypothetical protein